MTRIHVVLCAAVILLVLAAGCTFGKNAGPSPLVTETQAAAVTPSPSAPIAATATQPSAAGTQAPGTCPADVSSDAANCGGCGLACPANAVCQQGQCFCAQGYAASGNQCVASPAGTSAGNGCPSGMSPCPDGYCYELTSDAAHCGACGNTCPSGMICSASTCTSVPATTAITAATTTATATPTTGTSGPGTTLVAPGGFQFTCIALGLTNCGGTCVNTSTDSANCGSCGTKCTGPLMGCCGGTCKSYATDAANCGSCGHKCGALSSCVAGSCQAKAVVTGIGVYTYAIPKVPVTAPIYQQIPGQVIVPGNI